MIRHPGPQPPGPFGRLFDFLAQASVEFDSALRRLDLHWRRTDAGLLERFNPRYSPGAVILPALLAWGLTAGSPELDSLRFWLGLLAGAMMAMVSLALLRVTRERLNVAGDFFFQAVLVMIVCGLVWNTHRNQWNASYPYMHDLVPLTVTTILALVAGMLLLLLIGPPANFDAPARLRRTELFERREDPQRATWLGAVAAVGGILSGGLLHLFWLPAVAALLSSPTPLAVFQGAADFLDANVTPMPSITLVHVLFLATFLAMLVVLTLASLNPRLDAMWNLMTGALFRGGALPVSLMIVVLGIGRLAGVSYVTTVFDTDERLVFARWLGSLYFLAWWYDYWHKRLLAQRLLHWIRPQNPRAESYTSYAIEEECRLNTVGADHRKLQVHGSGRFVAIREAHDQPTLFQLHTMTSLFDKLSGSGGTPEEARYAREWRAKIVGFQVGVGILAVLFAAIPAFWLLHWGPQDPEATIRATGNRLDLANLLFADSCQDGRPVLAVAASGGGTRAALYTAAMLEALHREKVLDRVAAMSGVSGGGMALAYFASRRQDLLAGVPGGPAWNDFFTAMRQPYIVQVLHRASEWHMFKEGRLGIALADSFRDEWGKKGSRKTMGQVTDVGLLLNSTATGEFDAADVPPSTDALKDLEPRHLDRRRSDLAGARFVMTNLKLPADFASQIAEPRGRSAAPVVIDAPDLNLWEAAALNANFPPVFSNSAVDVETGSRTRYWVTDGGAADNRGLETLLWAVRSAVQTQRSTPCGHPPDILVVELDGGGFSNAFSQDRGAGAALAGGAQYASALSGEILGSLNRDDPKLQSGGHGAPGGRKRVQLFYLAMPLSMRVAWGTHWMLQDTIALRSDDRQQGPELISGMDAIELLRELHTSGTSPMSRINGWHEKVRGWLTADCWHTNEWQRLTQALRIDRHGEPPPANCPPEPAPGIR